VPANGRRGRPQGKCHREQTAGRPRPFGRIRQARVKRWGKSPPRERQRKRHGKPHREQDQIGAARRATGKAGFRAAARVGRARRSATGVPEEWPSIARKGEDRTRLTGRLTLSFRDDETKRSQLWCRSRTTWQATGGQFRGPGRCLPRPNCHFSKILSSCGRKRPPRQIIVRFRQRLDISCPTSCVGN